MDRAKAELLVPIPPSLLPIDLACGSGTVTGSLLPAPVKDAAFRQLKDYKPIPGLETSTRFMPKESRRRDRRQLPMIANKSEEVSAMGITMGVRTFLKASGSSKRNSLVKSLRSSARSHSERHPEDPSLRTHDHVGFNVQSVSMKPRKKSLQSSQLVEQKMRCSLGLKTMQAPTLEVPRNPSVRRDVLTDSPKLSPKPSAPRFEAPSPRASPSSPKATKSRDEWKADQNTSLLSSLPDLQPAQHRDNVYPDFQRSFSEEELARIQKRYKIFVAPDSALWAERRQAKKAAEENDLASEGIDV